MPVHPAVGVGSPLRHGPAQLVQPHGHDQGAADEVAGGDDVGEGDELDLVGEDRDEVGHLGPTGLGVDPVADGVLHEGVGGEDEVRRQEGADVHDPHAGRVQALGDAAPAEDPQAEEGRLEEEGEQRLEGQRRAEDVTDEAAVAAPVHPELELLDDAGDQAEGEVDREELAEELRHPQVALVARADPPRVVPGHDRGEPDRDRHEEEVVDGGDRELPPCEVEDVHPGSFYYVDEYDMT